MCAESIVIDEIIKANIGEKCGSAFGGLYVNAGIFEISCASSDGNGAVHDHGSKAFAQSKGHTIAIAIAMGHVPVGFGCFVASTCVLNGQDLFLSILTNVKSRHVIDIIEHTLRRADPRESHLLCSMMYTYNLFVKQILYTFSFFFMHEKKKKKYTIFA